MKKILTSIILAIVFLCGLFSFDVVEAFTDVPAGNWYSEAVDWAVNNNITNGVSSTLFSPDTTCTRAQIVTFLYRQDGEPSTGSSGSFSDVKKSDYFASAVSWAVENEITNGTGSRTFSPGNPCTRAQAVTFLYRYCGSPEVEKSDVFKDVNNGAYYANAVSWAVENEITQGTSATSFSPDMPCSRAHIVTFMYRAFGDDNNDDDYDDDYDDENDVSAGGASDLSDIIYSEEAETEHIAGGTLAGEEGAYEGIYVDNELIIDVDEDIAGEDDVWELIEREDGMVVGWIEFAGIYQIRFDDAMSLDRLNALITEYKGKTFVEDAYLNTVSGFQSNDSLTYPNDPWGIEDQSVRWNESEPDGHNWGFEAINAATARQMILDLDHYKNDKSKIPYIDFCVIDSMFEVGHQSHNDVTVYPVSARKPAGLAAAAMAGNATDAGLYKNYIHGTHVAAILGATGDNKIGLTGVNINSNISGFALFKVVNNGRYESYEASDYASGEITTFDKLTIIAYCLKEFGKPSGRPLIINYSVGSQGAAYDKNGKRLSEKQISRNAKKAREDNIENGKKVGALLEDIYKKEHIDFLIVSAAGNGKDGAEEDAQYNNEFNAIRADEYPDVYDRILVVGAACKSNKRHFSFWENFSYGERIDVAAPGIDIYSAAYPNERFNKKDYYTTGGTSMAAPQAAGIAGLLLESNKNLSGPELKSTIIKTANIRLNNTDAQGNEHAMVNAAAAIAAIRYKNYTVSGSEENGIQWTLSTQYSNEPLGKLMITGNGAIDNESGTYGWTRWTDNITEIEIGEGITKIGAEAFYDCRRLSKVTLPESLKEIEEDAFFNCSSLKSVRIPPSVIKNVGTSAFGYCKEESGNITPVERFFVYGVTGSKAQKYADDNGFFFIDSGNGKVRLSSHNTNCSWTLYENGNLVILGEGSIGDTWMAYTDSYGIGGTWTPTEASKVTITPGITRVGSYAFSKNEHIEEVVLPDTVTSIGSETFYNCTSLKQIVIPEGVTSIGDDSFHGCKALQSVVFKDNGETLSIGEFAFSGCSSLTSVTLKKQGTIGDAAFSYCTSLPAITIPEGITEIGESAFASCTSLKNITLPSSLTSLGSWMFNHCTSLETAVIKKSRVSEIPDLCFSSCPSLENVWIPKNITKIGDSAFSETKNPIIIHYAGTEADWAGVQLGSFAFSGSYDLRYEETI